MLLLFKLTVTPVLVGLASLAVRRWGNTIAGIIAGFPLMTAPIAVFLTIEQGSEFAANASVGIIIALIGVSAYAVAFATAAQFTPWPVALMASYLAFFAASWLAQMVITTLLQAALGAFAAIFLTTACLPRNRHALGPSRIPSWEIWMRMFATAAMILLVTTVAAAMGPIWTGIISTVPVIATVMATFTLARWGKDLTFLFLRSMMLSMFSFATFFVVVALLVQRIGPVATYIAATAAAVGLSPVVLAIDRALARRTAMRANRS